MATGVRVWFDFVGQCSGGNTVSNPCVSGCSDLIALGDLTHLNSEAGYSSTINTYYLKVLNSTSTFNKAGAFSASTINNFNPVIFGLFIDSTKVENENLPFIGTSGKTLPEHTRFINVYFGGVGEGVSYDISSAYASGNYAMMKTNHYIKVRDITSITLTATELPLYQLNTVPCSGDSDCECDGVNVCASKVQSKTIYGIVYGKDWSLNDVTQNIVLNFNNTNSVYVNLVNQFACITHISLYSDVNTYAGNGFVSCMGKYINLLELGFTLFNTLKNCSLGDYLDCVGDVLNSLGVVVSGLDRNVGSFEFEVCSQYAEFLPDLNFMAVTADINTDDELASDYARITNFLYPQIRFDISSGLEPVITCEDCCCDDYDTSNKSGGNGSLTITSTGGDNGGGDGEDFDDCVCDELEKINQTLRDKLTMINDKLQALVTAINGLDLNCQTTVEGTDLSGVITAINGLDLNCLTTVQPPVNQITVTPSTAQITNPITVTPCQPLVTVNPTDLSGLISAVNGLELSCVSNVTNNIDGLTCENSLGQQESLACIIKNALNYNGMSISEIQKKAFSKFDDCCDSDKWLVNGIFTENDDGCLVSLADLIKNKEFGSFFDVTVDGTDLVNYRKVFKDPLD